MRLILAVACLATMMGASSGSGDWGYDHNGTDKWPNLPKNTCGGDRQSPIDLSADHSQLSTIRKFETGINKTANDITLTLKNNGHSVMLSWSSGLTVQIGLSRDKLMYTAAQLHWHWGSVNTKGSEHTVDNATFAAEGHLVFYNSQDYANISDAANRPYGLAVLGVFYQISSPNPLLDLFVSALSNGTLTMKNGTAEVVVSAATFNIFEKFLPSNQAEFYRYDGSLTTPPCSESVLWTVYRQPVPISQEQLQLLRQLKFDDNVTSMANNYRPPQPLNPGRRAGTPRTVYRTFEAAACVATGLSLVVLVTVAMLAQLVTEHAA